MVNANQKALGMLATALEMEERGFEFYKRAVETCQHEAAREVFRTLQVDEALHMKRIRSLYAGLDQRGTWSDDWKTMTADHAGLARMFQEVARAHGEAIRADTRDLEAVDVGIGFEAQSVRFYEERLAEAEDPLERRFLEAMVGEERDHHRALQDTRLYLTDPAAWFAAVEGGHVDGG